MMGKHRIGDETMTRRPSAECQKIDAGDAISQSHHLSGHRIPLTAHRESTRGGMQ